MSGLRIATWIGSFALHAALALPLLWLDAGRSSFEAGTGEDELRIETTVVMPGLAQVGKDARTLQAVEAREVMPVTAVPPKPQEVKELTELSDVISSNTATTDPLPVVREIVPKMLEPVPPEQVVAAPAEVIVPVEEMVEAGGRQEGGDATARNAYFGSLRKHISRFRPRPKTRLTGTAVVRFTLNADGTLASRSIETSSGSPRLDEEALASIERAAPFPPFPSGMMQSQMELTQPFRFSVR
ncbi:MAG: TonB family protein [Hyphomicrobiaceae bacterium]|nr:TonB family protein [Hyphomicrobiaceae bacterium]